MGNYEFVIMKTSVVGIPHPTMRYLWRTSTSPSSLSIFRVFVHFFLMRAYGWIIRVISDDFAPTTGRRHATRGIAFRIFCDLCDFAKYEVARAGLSELYCILDINRTKNFPGSYFVRNYPFKCQSLMLIFNMSYVSFRNQLIS